MSPRTRSGPPATTLVVDAFPIDGPKVRVEGEMAPPSGAAHLFAGLRFALGRPRVLIVLCGWAWLLPLAPALVMSGSAERHLTQAWAPASEGPADFAGLTPTWMFREWEHVGAGEIAAAADALLPLLLLSSWFGLLVSSGWMHAAVHGRARHGLRAFFGGGGRLLIAFLRTWFLGLPLFALWTWMSWGAPGDWLASWWLPEGEALASSEHLARVVSATREVLYVAGLLAIELTLDLARATLAVGQRSSALIALGRGLREFARRPLALGVLVGAGFGLELLWIGALLGAASLFGMGPLALGLLLPFGRIACRGARFAALATFVAHAEALRADRRRGRDLPPLPEEYAAL